MSIRRGGCFLQYDENGQPYPTIDDEPDGPYVLYTDHQVEIENTWDEAYAAGYNHGTAHRELHACSLSYDHGYKRGVKAARESVEALVPYEMWDGVTSAWRIEKTDALAAIDALTDTHKSNNEGTTVPDTSTVTQHVTSSKELDTD